MTLITSCRRAGLAIAGLLVLAGPAAAQDILGDWEGTIATPAAKLRVVMHVTPAPEGLPNAALDSLDQGAMDLPGRVMRMEGDKVDVLFLAIGGGYSATLSPDGKTLTGMWTQGPADLPMTLSRKAATKP